MEKVEPIMGENGLKNILETLFDIFLGHHFAMEMPIRASKSKQKQKEPHPQWVWSAQVWFFVP